MNGPPLGGQPNDRVAAAPIDCVEGSVDYLDLEGVMVPRPSSVQFEVVSGLSVGRVDMVTPSHPRGHL